MKNYKVVRLLTEAHTQGRTSGEATFAATTKRIIEERDTARAELSQMFDDVVAEKTRAIEAELEVERLRAEIIQSHNHLHKWQEDVRQETSALAAEIGRLENENAEYRDNQTHNSHVDSRELSETDALFAGVAEGNWSNPDKVRWLVADLVQAKEQNESDQSYIESIESEKADMLAERDMLQAEIESKRAKIDWLNKDNARLESERIDMNPIMFDELQRLRQELACLHDENTAYSYASAFTAQHLADARLGRLVRAMPKTMTLRRQAVNWYSNGLVADTPEDALVAAGVTDPRQSATADAETPTEPNVERKQANDWQSRGDGVSEMAREAIREADAQRAKAPRDTQVVETQAAAVAVAERELIKAKTALLITTENVRLEKQHLADVTALAKQRAKKDEAAAKRAADPRYQA